MKIISRFFSIFLVYFLFYPFLSFAAPQKVTKILIVGNERVPKKAILKVIKTKVGEPFSDEKIREDVKRIYKIGSFKDVMVDLLSTKEGKEVTFVVIEKPIVKGIKIRGNKKIETKKIKSALSIPISNFVDEKILTRNVDIIKKLYADEGYYFAEINYNFIPLPENQVEVEFVIDEKKKSKIKKVEFVGNKRVKSKELRRVMKTRKWIFGLSWFTGSGYLNDEDLKDDLNRIKAYYLTKGFLRVKVGSPIIKFSSNKKKIFIKIPIEEGDRYKVGNVKLTGDVLTTRKDLYKKVKIKKGKIFNNSVLQADIARLTDLFADQGYAYADVVPDIKIDDKRKIVDITIDIKKGRKVYYERITITGNKTTRDKVIRRELDIAEGDLYNATAMKRSRRDLINTKYFSKVEFSTPRGSSSDLIDLNVNVEEAKTGQFAFGAGYSQLEGGAALVSLSKANLFGLGYFASASVKIGGKTKQYGVTFIDPWFLGYELSSGISLYRKQYEYTRYDLERKGGEIFFTKRIWRDFRVHLRYRYRRNTVNNVSENASIYIKDQEGTRDTSSIYTELIWDTRDNYLKPTRGMRFLLSGEYAGGFLAGDNYFYRIVGEGGVYIPMPKRTVFFVHGSAGIVDSFGGKSLPIYERFFLGGIKSLRGFEWGEAGPEDERGNVIGGLKELLLNLEYQFPLSRAIELYGVVFFDIGKAFDDFSYIGDPRYSSGFGLRWYSPLGPMRIDMGFNLDPWDDESRYTIDFTLGTFF
ncbi:MAG: outer membrane protein assembly factor BamA [Deltaproteobacteria bacterium]|nr:outer membrane protein assembly factor BamA [Deltaproteobacteria bacterium]